MSDAPLPSERGGGSLPPPPPSDLPPRSSIARRRVEVVVRNPDGTQVTCCKKWVITCLKVLLVAIIVGGLITASVFTFGAAGLFGAAAAASMGVTVASSTAAIGTLYTTGGVLLTSAGAMIRLAYKHRMGRYTGRDAADTQKFLANGAKKIAAIVKKNLAARVRGAMASGVSSSDASSSESGSSSDSDQEGGKVAKPAAVQRNAVAEAVRNIQARQNVLLPESVKKFFKTVFEALRAAQETGQNANARDAVDEVIRELQIRGERELSTRSRELIAQIFDVREWQEVLSESILPLLQDRDVLRQLGVVIK